MNCLNLVIVFYIDVRFLFEGHVVIGLIIELWHATQHEYPGWVAVLLWTYNVAIEQLIGGTVTLGSDRRGDRAVGRVARALVVVVVVAGRGADRDHGWSGLQCSS